MTLLVRLPESALLAYTVVRRLPGRPDAAPTPATIA
jgi:hypothetical protein